MSAAQRIKGRRAEAEVAALLRAAGFTVRGLEGGGDHLAVRGAGRLHIEVKRQERGFRTAWARQARDEAPPGSTACVVYRRSRAPWWIACRVDTSPSALPVVIDGDTWYLQPLADFLTVRA